MNRVKRVDSFPQLRTMFVISSCNINAQTGENYQDRSLIKVHETNVMKPKVAPVKASHFFVS